MARIPYLAVDDAPPAVQQAIGVLPPLNIFRMLGHASTALQPWLRLAAVILGDLELNPVLRELAILQVAKQSEAEYEWVQHVAIGGHVGLSDEQIAAVQSGRIADDPSLEASHRAVLLFTQEVVRQPRAEDATFKALHEHLNPREIVELLLTIGIYLMLARVMTVLEIEIDDSIGATVVELAERIPSTAPNDLDSGSEAAATRSSPSGSAASGP